MTNKENQESTMSQNTEEVLRRVVLAVWKTAKKLIKYGQVSVKLVNMGIFHGMMEKVVKSQGVEE